MIEIKVNCKDMRKHVDEVTRALQELKKEVKKSGIMQELRKREHYVSPSKARQIKHNESIKQRKRDEKKSQWQSKNKDF